ncbi:hypothetical protein ACHAPM_011263 [Fusarium culmorum]
MYNLQFLQKENLTDLNKMIQITRRAIDNASVAGQNPSTYSSDIALHLNERFLELGYLDNLEEIIRFSHKAIDDIPERLSDRF